MKAFGLLSLMAVVAIGGYLYAQNSSLRDGDGTGPAAGAEARATSGAAAANLQSAAVGLEAAHVSAGTYAGAEVNVPGVHLVRADAASYCLETGTGPATTHLRGPRGTAAPGPCR